MGFSRHGRIHRFCAYTPGSGSLPAVYRDRAGPQMVPLEDAFYFLPLWTGACAELCGYRFYRDRSGNGDFPHRGDRVIPRKPGRLASDRIRTGLFRMGAAPRDQK